MEKKLPEDIDFREGYVININKPLNWTSTDVVRKIKFRLEKCGYKKIKVGHAGTLDPLASGVLLVCTGKATKKVSELQDTVKEYIAKVTLGATTPSYDMEHPVDKTYPYEHITENKVLEAMATLTGERLQVPPVYSAKKIDGQRAYDYAREGEQVEMRRALVNIYSMELLDYKLPDLLIRVTCSKGTYIRSLAMELGQALNSGAYLSGLERTRVGEYSVKDSFSMEEILENIDPMKQN